MWMRGRSATVVRVAVLAGSLLAAAAPAGASTGTELIVDGGFESGDLGGWEASAPADPLLPWTVGGPGGGWFGNSAPPVGGRDAHHGFDAGTPGTFELARVVTIPARSVAELTWWQRIQWDLGEGAPATEARRAEVVVVDPDDGAVLEVLDSFSTGTRAGYRDTGWVRTEVALDAHAGSTVRIAFRQVVPERFTGPAQFEIDDIGLLVSPDPCATVEAPFTDVAPSSFAVADVACLYGLGVTTGTGATTYAPAELVTREQMAAFLARLLEVDGGSCDRSGTPFLDVPASSFAAADIACIADAGVTTGTGPGVYSPVRSVTREQMAAFLARLHVALGRTCPSGEAPFVDVAGSSFAADDVDCLHALGVTTGTSAVTFAPDEVVTREQMAAFLARLHRVGRGLSPAG
jgi:hypothetical protein